MKGSKFSHQSAFAAPNYDFAALSELALPLAIASVLLLTVVVLLSV